MTPQDAAAAFLRPPRRPAFEGVDLGFSPHRMAMPGGSLRFWRKGTGPTVLLVHGWDGTPGDFEPLTTALLAAGRSVLLVELPAHGGSDLAWTSVPHAADALRRLGDAVGPVHALIAHSVGGAIAARALEIGLAVERAVLIAAPARYRDYAHGHAAALGLPGDGAAAMLAQLASVYGVDVRRYATPDSVARIEVPGLVVHSAEDAVVPFRDAQAIAAAWVGAQLTRCEGLGHRRILSDPAVVDAVLRFVGAEARTARAC